MEPVKKADVHDLSDYYYSLSVCKDFPKIIAEYERILPILSAYSHYTIAWEVREAVYDALDLARIQLEMYEQIKQTKGKV